jgi:RNA polymerase subunit RPABC4/transcription elongation factor Spt4
MSNKNRILRKMALIGLAVFAVSALALTIVASLANNDEESRRAEKTRKHEELTGKYRAYLRETAKKVTKLPIDPNIAGQAQARYFEEQPKAELYFWAMDTQGQFQFGVPAEAFSRLNRAFDTYQAVILQEGRFVDRQDFLRRLIQGHRDIDFSGYEARAAGRTAPKESRNWQDWGGSDNDGLVFSVPFQNDQGQMLGNMYLKVNGIDREFWYHDNDYRGPATLFGILTAASALFLWFLLPTWVYLDAKGRGIETPARWSILTLVSLVFGLAVYLILRPEAATRGACRSCGRALDGGKFCPFCGSPAATDFCSKCGYPVRLEWSYCPNCQAPAKDISEAVPGEHEKPVVPAESQAT